MSYLVVDITYEYTAEAYGSAAGDGSWGIRCVAGPQPHDDLVDGLLPPPGALHKLNAAAPIRAVKRTKEMR